MYEFLNSHRAGHAYSKHHSIVHSNIFCLDFAVASPNRIGDIEVMQGRVFFRLSSIISR